MTVQQRLGGTFNLGGGDAHAIAFLEDLVRGDGLPIDADEVIGGPPVRNALGEEFLDGRAFGDFDVIGETGTVIVDLCGVRDYAEPEAIRHCFLAVLGNEGSA